MKQKRTRVLLVLLLLLAACTRTTDNPATKLASQLKNKLAVLADAEIGQYLVADNKDYYQATIDELSARKTVVYSDRENEGYDALIQLATIMVDDVSDDTITAVYLGTLQEGEENQATGIFIYYFPEGSPVSTALAEQANLVGDIDLEYFYSQGNYLLSAERDYLETIGLTADTLFETVDGILKT